jgi:hypothetical protein
VSCARRPQPPASCWRRDDARPIDDVRALGSAVARLSGGEEDAFRSLIEPHRPARYAHCYRMLDSMHDAEDALRNTPPAGLAGATHVPEQKLASHLAVPDRDQCLPRRDRPPPQARALEAPAPSPSARRQSRRASPPARACRGPGGAPVIDSITPRMPHGAEADQDAVHPERWVIPRRRLGGRSLRPGVPARHHGDVGCALAGHRRQPGPAVATCPSAWRSAGVR